MTALRIIDQRTGTATTTDAASQATAATSDTIPDGATVLFEARLTGRDIATGEVAVWQASGSAKRVSGTLSVVAVVDILTFVAGSDASLSTCAGTVDSSSNTLRVRVNGVLDTDIDWFGSITYWIN